MGHLIEFQQVYKIYQMGDSQVHALDGVSFTIDKGEFVAIVGQSGSGKSTAMNIIGCLDVPTSGKYLLGGVDVSTMDDDQQAEIRNKMLGFIFQQYNLIPDLNVYDNIVFPLELDGAKVDTEFIDELLKNLNIADKAEMLPSMLSGGEQQRVAIVRALAARPAIILADEPTGNLDTAGSHDVIGLLQVLARQYQQTVVVITHDPDIAQMAERIVRIEDGRILSPSPADERAEKGGRANAGK